MQVFIRMTTGLFLKLLTYILLFCRLFLPNPWGGLRGEELASVSGIKDVIFVHSNRFIGGHRTKEGAITMARKALELGKAI